MLNKNVDEQIESRSMDVGGFKDESMVYANDLEDLAKKQIEHYSLSCKDDRLVRSFLIHSNHCFDEQNELLMEILQGKVSVNARDSMGQTLLHLACKTSNHALLEFLLAQGADVDAFDIHGITGLHVAAARRDVQAVQLLISSDANPRTKTLAGFSPLLLAVQADCIPIVEILANHGCDVNETIVDHDIGGQYTYLHTAAERNFVKMVETLLRYKADVNKRDGHGKTTLHLVSYWGRLEIARLLLAYGARVHDRDSSGRTALYFAVNGCHKEIFDLLVHYGADLNDRTIDGSSLLHLAITRGDLEFVNILLRKGADLNAATKFGKSLVHCAIVERQWIALELLLSHGADVNHRAYYGKTPLHSAIECGRKEAFEILLRYKADTNAQDHLLQTPLHAAVREACPGTVQLLLQCGADMDAQDSSGQTPLQIACAREEYCYTGIVRAMLKIFAKQLVKKSVAGFAVNDAKAKELLQRVQDTDFRSRCADEIARMTVTKMFGSVTYYDFLRGTRRSLVGFAKNEEVIAIFEQQVHTAIFPVYAGLLEMNFAIGKRFDMILDDATERLRAICKYRLPHVPVEKIASYMNAMDMKSLLVAVPTLPITFEKEGC